MFNQKRNEGRKGRREREREEGWKGRREEGRTDVWRANILCHPIEQNQDQWVEITERQRKALPPSPSLEYLFPLSLGINSALTHSRSSGLSPDEIHSTKNSSNTKLTQYLQSVALIWPYHRLSMEISLILNIFFHQYVSKIYQSRTMHYISPYLQ